MDDKATYTNGVQERKRQATEDRELAVRIEAGEYRRGRFGEHWEWVNINDVVGRIAPGSEPEYQDGKIYFYNESRTLAVVADVGGGYLRIMDARKHGGRMYLDLYGNDANNYVDERGKQHGRSKPSYQQATHFRILRREDM